ncbi:hypothetical protein V6N12_005667 [Hibiscus sabdariffa]|uniref:Transposase MuDR plant domain-containing protein n=1 Tax=Hibiscus sabdariffa TaxID=183260 RepID=A0ABR2BAK0_9ROSI
MEIHHKGTLCFIDGENKYYDGEIDYFDWCNPTDLSLGYLNDCAQMLGYNEFITYHWRIPGNDLNDGLFKIEKDDDATIISLYVPDNRVVEIYFEHSSEFELARNVENSEDDCFIDSEYDLDDGDDGLVEIEVSSKIDMTSINESKERDKRKEKMIDTKPTRGSHDSLDNELASEFGYSSDVSDQLYLEYATSDNDSHFPRKRKHPEFDAGIDMKNPGFVVGMIFKDFDEFKNVCRQYSLVNQLGINFKHNDKDRVDVRCKEGCPFRIWASKMPDKMTVQIKSIVDEHSCSKIFENKFASVELLAYKFLDVFRDDPNMKVNTFLAKGDAIIPPELLKSKRGRHQTKRRKDIVEIHEEKEKKNNLSKLSRKGLKMTCSICGQQGHNKRFHGVDNRLQESTQVGSFEPLENPLQDFVEDI